MKKRALLSSRVARPYHTACNYSSFSPYRAICRKTFEHNLYFWYYSAITIQKTYKMHVAIMMKKQLKQEKSALIIQKYWRGYEIRKIIRQQHQAATVIQKTWKGAVQRAEYLRTRSYIIDLQCWTRMVLARKRYVQILETKSQAALTIQTNFRKYLAQRTVQKLKAEKAALILQKYWKSFITRQKYVILRRKTLLLQSWIRGYNARKAYDLKIIKRHSAAIIIQKTVRMYLAQNKFVKLKNQLESERLSLEMRQENAALILQNAFKCWNDRTAFLRKRNSATLIKAAWRGYKARMALKKAVIGNNF